MSLVERTQDLTPEPVNSGGALVSIIERLAVDPRVDVDKLERLLQMQERVLTRNARIAFDAAVSLAKGEIGPIYKNKSVDFTSQKGRTNYRYEDFAEVARTVDPVLARHGLSYRHRASQNGPKLSVTCILSHRDGHAEETTLEAGNDTSGNKNEHQAVGSAATYLQRYTLKLSLGLSATTDDDGKVAATATLVEADQAAFVEQQLRDTSSDVAKFLQTIGAQSVESMTVTQYQKAVALLAAKKARMANG